MKCIVSGFVRIELGKSEQLDSVGWRSVGGWLGLRVSGDGTGSLNKRLPFVYHKFVNRRCRV